MGGTRVQGTPLPLTLSQSPGACPCCALSSPSDLCTVVSSCLSLVCVLGTGRLPGHPSTKEKFSLPATANATLVGKQDYPACTSEAKADGGEHLYSGQPMLLLLGQLNKRLSLRRGLHQPELLRPQEHLGEDSAQCPQLCTHSGEEFYFTAGHA